MVWARFRCWFPFPVPLPRLCSYGCVQVTLFNAINANWKFYAFPTAVACTIEFFGSLRLNAPSWRFIAWQWHAKIHNFRARPPENPFAHWMSFAPLINHIHTLVSEIPSRENGKTSRSHSWILWPLYGLKPRTRSGFIANTLSRLWRTHYNYLEHVNKAEISQGEWRTGNQHKNKPEARCINHPPNWPPTYPPTHASLHHSVEH